MLILYNDLRLFLKLVNSEFYNDFETFSKLVHGNENGNGNVSTNKILGSLEILAIKKTWVTIKAKLFIIKSWFFGVVLVF